MRLTTSKRQKKFGLNCLTRVEGYIKEKAEIIEKKMTQCTCLEASLWNYEHEKDTFDKNHTDPLKMKRYKTGTTIQSKLSSVDCQVVGHFLFEKVLLRSEAMRILIKQILTAPFSTKRFQIICWLEPASSI